MADRPTTSQQLIANLRACVSELEMWQAERSQAEARLRRSEEQARGLLEAAPDAMVVVDQQGQIVLVNAQVEALFGFTREELIGHPVEVLVPERMREGHRGHRGGYKATPNVRPMGADLDLFARRKDGTEFPVEISLSPFRAGDEMLVSSAIRDVSQRVAVEHELRRAKDEAEAANRTKSDFLAAASHDLRQPLQAARLYLEVVRDQPANDEAIDKLGLCLKGLADLLTSLLNVARLDAGAVEPVVTVFPIGEILERLVREFTPMAEKKGIVLRAVATRAQIETDPQLVHEALANLVSNAVRYTDEGRVILGCRRRGSGLAVQVLDTGRGIPSAQIDNIFEEFYQIDNSARDRSMGVGLGLAIVHRVAAALGCEVAVRSEEGRGSMFELTLPRAAKVESSAGAVDASAGSDRRTALIAVIDDDPFVLEGLQLALESKGHRVVAARSQQEAVERLRENTQPPEVVVSDYRLEAGRTGIEALQAIRDEFGATISGLLLTGDTSLVFLEDLGRQQAFRVLSKPVSVETLELEINASIAAKQLA